MVVRESSKTEIVELKNLDWDKIPDNETIYLKKTVAKRIVRSAIKKAGSKGYLVKHVLLSSSRVPDVTFLEKIANGDRGLRKHRLERLINFLGLDPEEIACSIVAIGRKKRRKKL